MHPSIHEHIPSFIFSKGFIEGLIWSTRNCQALERPSHLTDLSFPFGRGRDWGPKKLSDLSKAMQGDTEGLDLQYSTVSSTLEFSCDYLNFPPLQLQAQAQYSHAMVWDASRSITLAFNTLNIKNSWRIYYICSTFYRCPILSTLLFLTSPHSHNPFCSSRWLCFYSEYTHTWLHVTLSNLGTTNDRRKMYLSFWGWPNVIVSLYIHFLSKNIISFAFMAEKKNPTFSLHKLSLSFYVYEGLPECVYVHHVHAWGGHRSQGRASDPLKRELWMIGSHHVGVVNWSQILHKNKGPWPLSHPSDLTHRTFFTRPSVVGS